MVEVVDRRGRIVARSLSLGGRVLPRRARAAGDRDGEGRYGTIDALAATQLRVYAAPLADVVGAAAGGAVVVAASTADVADTDLAPLHVLTAARGARAAAIGGARASRS